MLTVDSSQKMLLLTHLHTILQTTPGQARVLVTVKKAGQEVYREARAARP